ncbi:restriction endonuclease [Prevotella dentasini]|uniref:restriction endonuclease n=1 Tax=Prevotella dentasini TaxID=589537 RepID=UPI000469FF07|nr:restriction endonuclease [Prevotella dentasini]
MNWFLEQSLEYASQKAYLDDLYRVYPTIPNGIRNLNEKVWDKVEAAYYSRDHKALIENLLKLKLFPIKDSYVAFLKKDRSSLERNPRTVNRLASEIMEMDLDKLYEKCSQPKETNRQIGPMFKNWVNSGVLGFPLMKKEEFESREDDGILNASDQDMKLFAREQLGYHHSKGLDFVARIHGRYVIGEAKFLSDFSRHQNAQFNDAMATLESDADAIKIAILDGVVYIRNKGKMYTDITEKHKNSNIMSVLLLRNFLNTL